MALPYGHLHTSYMSNNTAGCVIHTTDTADAPLNAHNAHTSSFHSFSVYITQIIHHVFAAKSHFICIS